MNWGIHQILDCKGGNQELITSFTNIEAFVISLVREIDMISYGKLMMDRFATHDIEKAGISFCQMIETSHLAGHFCENTGDFYLDIFSCKPFETSVVMRLAKQYFSPKSMTSRVFIRDVNHHSREVQEYTAVGIL